MWVNRWCFSIKNDYICCMFVVKRKNKSGSITVVVAIKVKRCNKEIKNFGTVKTKAEADALHAEAQRWMDGYGGLQRIDFEDNLGREREETERVVSNMDSLPLNGTQLLPGRIYGAIGFGTIGDEILMLLATTKKTKFEMTKFWEYKCCKT